MKKQKVIVTKKRNVNTYAFMWQTSFFHLKLGQEQKLDSFYHFMASLVFTAFTFEAYLNHVGQKQFTCWEDLEHLSPPKKLNIICERLGVSINSGRRPWQVLKHLFGFRNDIAHGKTEEIITSEEMLVDEYFDEDFVNYVEDVDLSWRAQLRFWSCVYNPKAIAYHERGATRKNSNKIKRDYLVYGFRNRYASMVKNMTSGYWKKNRVKIICRELLFLFSPYAGVSRTVRFKALFLALIMLRKMLAKRRVIQQRKLVTDGYMDIFFCYDEVELKQLAKGLLSLINYRRKNNKG
jgi:hypothetical protein